MVREPPIRIDKGVHGRRQIERARARRLAAEREQRPRAWVHRADMAYCAAEDGCGDTEFFSSGSASLESRATAAAISRSHLGESRFFAAASE